MQLSLYLFPTLSHFKLYISLFIIISFLLLSYYLYLSSLSITLYPFNPFFSHYILWGYNLSLNLYPSLSHYILWDYNLSLCLYPSISHYILWGYNLSLYLFPFLPHYLILFISLACTLFKIIQFSGISYFFHSSWSRSTLDKIYIFKITY